MTSTRSTLPAPASADDSADVPADPSADFPADFPAVDAAVAGARAAFVPDVDLATRLDRLHRLEDLVRENRTVLEEALASARALGGTLNDWFVTGAVNGSIRYHAARGVELASLNTSFVVSTRTDRDIGGNAFTPTRISVPAHAMDPGDRFRAIQATMHEKRSGVSGGGALAGLSGIAVGARSTLVLDRDETVRSAERAGLFVISVGLPWMDPAA